jgi:hypothetical protein
MVSQYSGSGVPKYSAEWWKRVSASLHEERTVNEHIPPSTARTSWEFDEQTKNDVTQFSDTSLSATVRERLNR